jgi:hypothetical protein
MHKPGELPVLGFSQARDRFYWPRAPDHRLISKTGLRFKIYSKIKNRKHTLDKQFCPLEKGKFADVNISMFWRTAYAIELYR